MTGDLSSPSIDLMGTCVCSPTREILFTGGHGVVVASDPFASILEVVWPTSTWRCDSTPWDRTA
jgi:hypothetical protein